jgi:hypothetical protein
MNPLHATIEVFAAEGYTHVDGPSTWQRRPHVLESAGRLQLSKRNRIQHFPHLCLEIVSESRSYHRPISIDPILLLL